MLKYAVVMVIVLTLASGVAKAGGNECGDGGNSVEVGIKSALGQIKIENLTYNKNLEMYELSLTDSPKPVFVTKDYKYVILGDVIEVATRKNLAESKPVKSATPVSLDFSKLALENALKISEGSKKMAVFLDVDCPWSRKMYQELKKLSGTQIEIFLYPLPELHPKAREKSIAVWCAQNRTSALTQIMEGSGNDLDKKECPNPVEDNMLFAFRHGIKATPTIILEDGRLISGYLSAEQLSSYLNAK